MGKTTKYKRFKQSGGVQSRQESVVKSAYPGLVFKPRPVPYVREHLYNPDLLLGKDADGMTHFLELKEWMTEADITKYKCVLECNTHVVLHFLIYDAPVKVFTRLSQLPRCIVKQGFATIPQEWLTYDQPLQTTVLLPGVPSQPIGGNLSKVEPPSVRSLQRKSRHHNEECDDVRSYHHNGGCTGDVIPPEV